ncbi:hypothetical protein GF356_05715 [candidate division GN15 bacterium]|jgi:hypothetical protein|nr:hypothetical protein [candidate division GN15 bacterium]
MTDTPLLIGTVGAGLLLLGFVLNLTRLITERSLIYLLMNLIGASLATWYAWITETWPFVALELVWAMAALIRLGLKYGHKKAPA